MDLLFSRDRQIWVKAAVEQELAELQSRLRRVLEISPRNGVAVSNVGSLSGYREVQFRLKGRLLCRCEEEDARDARVLLLMCMKYLHPLVPNKKTVQAEPPACYACFLIRYTRGLAFQFLNNWLESVKHKLLVYIDTFETPSLRE